jgi:hypothetical protein
MTSVVWRFNSGFSRFVLRPERIEEVPGGVGTLQLKTKLIHNQDLITSKSNLQTTYSLASEINNKCCHLFK